MKDENQTNMEVDVKKVVTFCIENKENIDLENQILGSEFYYASLPLCVVDSVFSIGVKYKNVQNVMRNLYEHFKLQMYRTDKTTFPTKAEQISVSAFKESFKDMSYEKIAKDIVNNRQRTSQTNGILKVEAMLQFLDVLIKYEVEYFSDVNKLDNNKEFEEEIKKIKGQTSGISLTYFFMLAGNDNLIKPDRMVVGFLNEILNRNVKLEECQPILEAVCNELIKSGFIELTPKLLDNKIWQYQRKKKNNSTLKNKTL